MIHTRILYSAQLCNQNCSKQIPSLHVYKYFVCLFVCLKSINANTTEQIGPYMTPGQVYGCSKLHKFVSIYLDFCKILKVQEKNIFESANFFYCFILYKEKMLTDKSLRGEGAQENWGDVSFPGKLGADDPPPWKIRSTKNESAQLLSLVWF